jgi:anti-sigma factor RsiW
MNCQDTQRLISKLHDGELPAEISAGVFQHLSACTECRDFFFSLQALDRAMDRIADRLPSAVSSLSALPSAFPRPHTWWNQRVALRLPVLALLICAIAASVFLVLPGGVLSREPQSIYVTKLPTVVVDATTAAPQP